MKNNRWYGDIGKIWTRSYFTVARWIWIFLDVWCLFDLVLFPVVFTVLFIVHIARGRSSHPPGEFSFHFSLLVLRLFIDHIKQLKHDFHVLQTWLPRITSGRSRGGGPGACPPPPLFLDQTEDWRAEKKFFGDRPPPVISGSGWPPPPPPEILVHSVYWPWRHHFAKVIHGEPRAG